MVRQGRSREQKNFTEADEENQGLSSQCFVSFVAFCFKRGGSPAESR
jgi:hypothetical protein